ncbi:hypothetical protein LTS14_005293 [Recurvomyces mirabilis]|nr:hypothetical protein LTS14_005293 [Recurvomyces mirabilis]
MVYEYEEPTSFFPTVSTEVVKDVSQYQAYTGDLDNIRFPELSADDVVKRARLVFNKEEARLRLV